MASSWESLNILRDSCSSVQLLHFHFLVPSPQAKSRFIMFYHHVLSHFIILNRIVSQSATWTVLEHSTVYFLSIRCSYSRLLIRECTCFLRSMKSDSPLQSQSWLALPCPEFCGSGCTLGCFEHVPTCSNMFQLHEATGSTWQQWRNRSSRPLVNEWLGAHLASLPIFAHPLRDFAGALHFLSFHIFPLFSTLFSIVSISASTFAVLVSVTSCLEHAVQGKNVEHTLFSFHGVPEDL